jgi:hypothetical protein
VGQVGAQTTLREVGLTCWIERRDDVTDRPTDGGALVLLEVLP